MILCTSATCWIPPEDGTITSRSTKEKPCKRHHYLMWRGGKPGEFELRLSYRINGVLMAQAIDNDKKHAARNGVIALQMHPGPPMTVQFRNLRIRIFD